MKKHSDELRTIYDDEPNAVPRDYLFGHENADKVTQTGWRLFRGPPCETGASEVMHVATRMTHVQEQSECDSLSHDDEGGS
jgi:hypothetical protein